MIATPFKVKETKKHQYQNTFVIQTLQKSRIISIFAGTIND